MKPTILASCIIFITFSSLRANAESFYDGFHNVGRFLDSDGQHLKRPSQMDERHLQEARLEEQAWSGYYWPYRVGILGFRPRDPELPFTLRSFGGTWEEYHSYVSENPVSDYLEEGTIAHLSPSEKYDLLVGDEEQTLTKTMWNWGRRQASYYSSKGKKIPWWVGICNGWAAASSMMEKPTAKVEVTAADGKTVIPFFPYDIKALASLLGKHTQLRELREEIFVIGRRCNREASAIEFGRENRRRIENPKCFDVNPGSWHMAVVNMIGVSQRPFIMDKDYDQTVWNYPVYAYKYVYFNPEKKDEKSLRAVDVAIEVSDYERDPYKAYRSTITKQIVGVIMDVWFTRDHLVSDLADEQERDKSGHVVYTYDLELNSRGEIIGGEWHQSEHPDFLWAISANRRFLTELDHMILEEIEEMDMTGFDSSVMLWDGAGPIPEDWKASISETSKLGQPLGLIVEGLIRHSIRQRSVIEEHQKEHQAKAFLKAGGTE